MTVVNPKSISGINSITTGSGSDDLLTIHNNSGAERFRVDGSGNTRITSGIVTSLEVANINTGGVTATFGGVIDASQGVITDDSITHRSDTNTKIRFPADDTVTVETGGTERSRIDSAGRLLVGATASEAMFYTGRLQVQGTNSSTSAIAVKSNQNDSGGPAIVLGKSRGTSAGAVTVVQSGDELGSIYWNGADGTDTNSYAAAIRGQVDGSPGSNDMPGRLIFLTTADGAATSTERMRINSVGKVGINSTSPDGMLAIEHTSSAPNLTMRNHPAAGPYTNEYGMELRHAYGSVKHGALIHTQEAADGRRSLDVSDSNGVFATFANGKVGINTYTPNNMLHINGLNGSACIKMDDNGQPNRYGKIFNYAEGIHLQARNNTNKGNVVFRGEDAGATIYYGRFTENGLCFSSDSAAANALDDYEEGSWTPNMLDGNGSNYTIQVDTARYTKIGRLVHCHYQIKRTENGSKTGTLRISNLPFAHDGTSIQGSNWWCDHGSPTDGLGDIVGGIHSVGSGTSSVYFVKPTDESGIGVASSRYLQHGQWTLNRWLYGSFIYYSAT